MSNINYIRQLFVRQISHNDCGLACLQMILNYSGKSEHKIGVPAAVKDNGLSLLQLRELAAQAGLKSRCVELEMDWMRTNTVPCILHMVKEHIGYHFQVCFGVRKKGNSFQYLMADPAGQVYYLPEDILERQWQSKAALYFDDLPVADQIHYKSPLQHLLSMDLFPKVFWVSIPVLNIFVVFLGVSISWVLQAGMQDSFRDKKPSLINAIILLFFVITMFRSLLSYLRQRILINLNNRINSKLVNGFLLNLLNGSAAYQSVFTDRYIKNQLAEIQKIQNANSAFVSIILSDGSLMLMALACLFYSSWLIGLVNAIYLMLLGFFTFKKQPGLSMAYTNLHELLGQAESSLLKHMNSNDRLLRDVNKPDGIKSHRENHGRYLEHARETAIAISKTNFWYEWIGTIAVMLVFTNGIIQLQRQSISYGTFLTWVILSFFISSLMPKICNALYVLTEGAEAANQYRSAVHPRP